MDTTATFSNRSNARRAAEAMIRKGTAPAVDYGVKPLDHGRFEIAWKAAAEPTEPATAAAAAEPAPESQPAAAGRAPQNRDMRSTPRRSPPAGFPKRRRW